MMRAIHRHYDRVRAELRPDTDSEMLPSRVHALVLVSTLHKPAQRAISFARATRPDTITAITVNMDDNETRALQQEWDARNLKVPLKVIESAYREITRPLITYVKNLRRQSPRDVICVYIPEYVVGRWWENLLHNQSALRLKRRLLFEPGVMVTSVPYLLDSTTHRNLDRIDHTPGDIRRGITPPTNPDDTEHTDAH